MNANMKRKNSGNAGRDSFVPNKKQKNDFGKSRQESKNGFGKPKLQGQDRDGADSKNFAKQGNAKKKGFQRNTEKKQKLTSIVTEAKANYQLYSDKKINKDEKLMLMNSTYDIIKDYIPELARMKGMGKIIGSFIDRSKGSQKRVMHVLSFYDSTEAKLLLIKSNGYKLAAKLVQNGTPKTVNQFVEACLSNGKGLRGLMTNPKAAVVLNATYVHCNATNKRTILSKLVFGTMPVSNDGVPLHEIFSTCKKEVIEDCKSFIQSVLVEKTFKYEIVQDILVVCIQSHKSTGMNVDEYIKMASENILPLCYRSTNCTLALWTVWLATAQMRKHIMKGLKGKVVSLLHTYNGRMFLMALTESTDDTKALFNGVLKEIMASLEVLLKDTDARKLIEFLLLPRSTKFMHPKDIEILKLGDAIRTSKKSDDARFNEIQEYIKEPVLSAFDSGYEEWLQDNKLCLVIIAIVNRYTHNLESEILTKLATAVASKSFADRIVNKAVRMVLEELVSADTARYESNDAAPLFINELVPILKKPQIANLVENCPRLVSHILKNSKQLKKGLSFKPKNTWLHQDDVKKKIDEWLKQNEQS